MEQNKFELVFTLKQHTPLIHFQSDQPGATLRATELKPKLDRFLIENVFKNDKNQYKKFLIINQEKALRFKVKIKPNDNIKYYLPLSIDGLNKNKEQKVKNFLKDLVKDFDFLYSAPFFANADKIKFKRKSDEIDQDKSKKENIIFAIYTNQPTKVIINSWNKELLKVIEENIDIFFLKENFGTRQSKGFGSFYLDNKKFDVDAIPHKVYSFSTKNWQQDIKLFYQFLRQGINLPRGRNPFYAKPAIFAYAKSQGWQWDKKTIKQTFFPNDLKMQKQAHPDSDVLSFESENKYLLRDIFGLSSSQEWLSYKETIEKSHPEIERFKSPLTFKVVDNEVYFWANESVQEVLGETFKVTAKKRGKTLTLSTPETFDFDAFFDFSFNLDLSKHIASEFHNTNEYKSLVRIFKDIKGVK